MVYFEGKLNPTLIEDDVAGISHHGWQTTLQRTLRTQLNCLSHVIRLARGQQVNSFRHVSAGKHPAVFTLIGLSEDKTTRKKMSGGSEQRSARVECLEHLGLMGRLTGEQEPGRECREVGV